MLEDLGSSKAGVKAARSLAGQFSLLALVGIKRNGRNHESGHELTIVAGGEGAWGFIVLFPLLVYI